MIRTLKVIAEELRELNRRTDILPTLLEHTMLNDDWEYDLDDDDEAPALGVVSFAIIILSLFGLWAMLSALLIILP